MSRWQSGIGPVGDLLAEIISKVRTVAVEVGSSTGEIAAERKGREQGSDLEVLSYLLVSSSRKKNQKC